MSLIPCPECGSEISDRALMCPHCGRAMRSAYWCWDYRSTRTLYGLPLVHICMGPPFDPTTGRLRIAKGIIAVGPIALGVFAMGGCALGVLAFGGFALGVLAALGGCAVALGLACGGAAVGTIALGGLAIGYVAIGGGAFGVHALGGNHPNPQLREHSRRFFTGG